MKLYKGNVQKIMIQDDQGESEKYKGIDTSVDGVMSPNQFTCVFPQLL